MIETFRNKTRMVVKETDRKTSVWRHKYRQPGNSGLYYLIVLLHFTCLSLPFNKIGQNVTNYFKRNHTRSYNDLGFRLRQGWLPMISSSLVWTSVQPSLGRIAFSLDEPNVSLMFIVLALPMSTLLTISKSLSRKFSTKGPFDSWVNVTAGLVATISLLRRYLASLPTT